MATFKDRMDVMAQSGFKILRASETFSLTSVVNTTTLVTITMPVPFKQTPTITGIGSDDPQGCFFNKGISSVSPSQVVLKMRTLSPSGVTDASVIVYVDLLGESA